MATSQARPEAVACVDMMVGVVNWVWPVRQECPFVVSFGARPTAPLEFAPYNNKIIRSIVQGVFCPLKTILCIF